MPLKPTTSPGLTHTPNTCLNAFLARSFDDKGAPEKLLIVRPSVVGPAQSFPFPDYSIPTSTPSTMLGAALGLPPSLSVTMATRFMSPETMTTTDEVSVDVVVDRMLVHLAAKTPGPVHAVSGERARRVFKQYMGAYVSYRKVPWAPKPIWKAVD